MAKVQGPVKEPQPDGMSRRRWGGGGGVIGLCPMGAALATAALLCQ